MGKLDFSFTIAEVFIFSRQGSNYGIIISFMDTSPHGRGQESNH